MSENLACNAIQWFPRMKGRVIIQTYCSQNKTELCHLPVLVKHSKIVNVCSVVDLMNKQLQADQDF